MLRNLMYRELESGHDRRLEDVEPEVTERVVGLAVSFVLTEGADDEDVIGAFKNVFFVGIQLARAEVGNARLSDD